MVEKVPPLSCISSEGGGGGYFILIKINIPPHLAFRARERMWWWCGDVASAAKVRF